MRLVFYFIGAFFVGAIPNAYIAGRWLKKMDIRQHGSGNVGATNVFRMLGKPAGIVVFLLDFLKGALPAALFGLVFPDRADVAMMSMLAGLFAVLGHIFTPFLSFKGGKGVATGAGALCVAFPPLFLIATVSWGISFLVCKIVSLSSLISVGLLFLACLVMGYSLAERALFFAILNLVFWSHRSNISRLLRGEERAVGKSIK